MKVFNKKILELIKKTSLSFEGVSNLILYMLCLVHGILAILFAFAGVSVLVISNVIAIVLYMVFHMICESRACYICFVRVVFIIVELHSMFSFVVIGLDFGFNYYCITMLPLYVFMLYFFKKENIKLKTVLFWDFVLLVIVMVLRGFIGRYGGFVELGPLWAIGISTFNILVCGTTTMLLSGVFVYQRMYTDERLKKQTDRLDFMANYDALTMLRNRRNLRSILMREFYQRQKNMSEKPICIALGDIDDFKKINDMYGHDCGDMVLVKIGSIFLDKIKGKGYVARWGGEEVLILIQVPFEESKVLIEDIRKEINDLVFTYNKKEFHVSMTFGLTEYSKGVTLDEMLIKADVLMYQGKKAGKNQMVV